MTPPRDCATCARLSEEYVASVNGRLAAREDAEAAMRQVVAELATVTAGLSGQVADLQRRLEVLEDAQLGRGN